MKGEVVGIVVVLALLATGAIFFAGNFFTQPTPAMQTYQNDMYGISFSYPEGYILSEDDVNPLGTPRHHVVTIIREEDAVPRLNSEGPTAITLDFYESSTTLANWLASPVSNLYLGSSYASTTVDGEDAVSYGWSGLYEGNTVAFTHKNAVVAATVTFISPADQIVADYEALLSSIRLH